MKQKITLTSLLRPYTTLIALLVLCTVIANACALLLPKLLAGAIDSFTKGQFLLHPFLLTYGLASVGIFIFTYFQTIVQVYASEKVAFDLRGSVTESISRKQYSFIETVTPAKILTNLTSDIDSIKTFVSQAIASLISSVFIIIGSGVLLFSINWKLALLVLTIVPVIGIIFAIVLSKVRTLFKASQAAIDQLNAVINESILGAALIRLFNAEDSEKNKFVHASTRSKEIGMKILSLFSILIPSITFMTNMATLIILLYGGYSVSTGTMSLGNLTAFNSYLAILIFPILIIGFMSNVIAQATASLERISSIFEAPDAPVEGGVTKNMTGLLSVKNVTLSLDGKTIVKDVSFTALPGTRTAIIGPTAAGKTQLLTMLIGLQQPSAGTIEYDHESLQNFNKKNFYEQVGIVFQDSILFNLSIRENIALSEKAKDEDLALAIQTAALDDFLAMLPDGLDTIVSERGSSLSGGQKQRIMLARALCLNPKVLLLDDFTARVDQKTEKTILENVQKNYPSLTLISVTQKIAPIESYDQIIVLMEGELLARGVHSELLLQSPEYVQMFESQKSTSSYEV